jgi:hypothetical protein
MIAGIIDDNYERIRDDLVRLGLTYDRLMDDVLDHVCCMVEEDMNAGEDFESSYDRVLQSIGDKRLPQVQHQTLLNLDKKFQRMKKFTYLFGLTSALLCIVGALFKRMHWPAAGILITLGILLVVAVFLPLYFVINHREQTEKKNPVYGIVGYFTLALLLAGALFKIMHWPGAGMMLQVGVGILLIGFIPLYVVNVFQRGGKESVRLPYIVMLVVGIAIVILMTNVRMSKYAIDIYTEEIVNNESFMNEIDKRTAQFLVAARDTAFADRQGQITRIHSQVGTLQQMTGQLKSILLESVGQPGVGISEVKGKEMRRKLWDDNQVYDLETEFIREARVLQDMLDEMVPDQVVQAQIYDHLEFTRKIWPHAFGARVLVGEPFVVNYLMVTKVSKGIALSEYLAIDYLLRR